MKVHGATHGEQRECAVLLVEQERVLALHAHVVREHHSQASDRAAAAAQRTHTHRAAT